MINVSFGFNNKNLEQIIKENNIKARHICKIILENIPKEEIIKIYNQFNRTTEIKQEKKKIIGFIPKK